MPVVHKALEVRALRDENRAAEGGARAALRVRQHHRPQRRRCRRSSPPSSAWRPRAPPCCWPGESGVGKDLIARAIHFHSPRRDRPLVKINCTAHPGKPDGERAVRLREGRLHRSATRPSPASSSRPIPARCSWTRSATCPPPIQVKLLRILQEREFERLGSNKTRHIDVRVVAATNSGPARRARSRARSARTSITA